MELWFFYAIIGSLAIGVNNYFVKVLADRNIDGSLLTFFQGAAYLLLGVGESLFRGYDIRHIVWYDPALGYSVLIAFVIFLNLRFRVIALRYLSSSEYYIGYRIFLTIILAIIGIIFLGENITETQFFGLVLGSIAITFLFEEDERLRHSRNWGRAIGFLSLSILAGVGIQILGKMQGISDFPFSLMLFAQGIIMLSISTLFDRKSIIHFFRYEEAKARVLFILVPATIFVYLAATFNLYAYHAGGSVSVVTKIYAYSLFVPIILSLLFSQEKITYKKTIAIFLTIVSLYYMV